MTLQCVVSVLLIISFVATEAEEKCDYLQNIKVTATANNKSVEETINGCFQEKNFKNKDITAVYLDDSLPYLGKDAVSDMPKLEVFSSFARDLSEIEAGAFRNVPELKILSIRLGQLKEISRDVFNSIPQLEHITLSNHQIDYIADLSFANLKFLKAVVFSNNNLQYWNREWFTNTTSLEKMNFPSNKIRFLPRRAFYGLSKLRDIHFGSNEISVIHPDAFKGLTNLRYLGLNNNRLKTINEDIFPNKLKVNAMFIQANYLNFLPNEVLKKISVKNLNLHANPWKCPCLDRINYWLYETNGTVDTTEECDAAHIPLCMYPKSFSHTCIETVDDQLTNSFIESYRKIATQYSDYCIRLD